MLRATLRPKDDVNKTWNNQLPIFFFPAQHLSDFMLRPETYQKVCNVGWLDTLERHVKIIGPSGSFEEGGPNYVGAWAHYDPLSKSGADISLHKSIELLIDNGVEGDYVRVS